MEASSYTLHAYDGSTMLEKLSIGNGYAGTVDVKGIPAHLRLNSQRDTSDWDSGDFIGKLDFYVGSDSTNNLPYNAGYIHCLNETDNANEPSGALIFGTTTANLSGGAVERMRLGAGGTLQIGNSGSITPGGLLHLYQASNDPYIVIQRGSGDSANAIGGISWKNNTNTIAGIYAQTDNINDGTLRFHTAEGGTNTEKLQITKAGAVVVQREHLQIQRAGSNTANFTKGGIVFATPAYNEYHYTWSGQSSYTIDLTCASYFHCEFIYTQHQTNGGNEMHYYARGKWANNHTTHTGYMYEMSGDGGGLSVSFTVSDQSGNGSVDMKGGLTAAGSPGSTYRGLYGGGHEGSSSSANGRLRIAESFSWGSVSSRALIVKVYYGSFSISKS